jgi:Formin Homology 2 Domain
MKVANTLFADEEFQKSAKIDEETEKELLEEFSSLPPPKKENDGGDGSATAAAAGPKTAGILESQRTTNIMIMLRKFTCGPEEIVKHVNSLDPLCEYLSDDNVTALSANAFKAEELEMARTYAAPAEDVAKLNAAEALAYHVARAPRFSKKIKAMWAMRTAVAVGDEIRASMMLVISASQEVRKSKKFELVLATVLGIGNFLNAGTAKGQARGFRLETLPKLCDTKTRGGDTTLLHYVVQVVGKKAPSAVLFYKDMPHVVPAKRECKEDIAKELKTFQAGVALLGAEIMALTAESRAASSGGASPKPAVPPPPSMGRGNCSKNPEQASEGKADGQGCAENGMQDDGEERPRATSRAQSPLEVARALYAKAEEASNELQNLQELMLREFADTTSFLGEDTRTAKTEEVFDTLTKFLLSFEGCVKDLEKRKENEARALRLAKRNAEEEAKREARQKKTNAATDKKAVAVEGDGTVDDDDAAEESAEVPEFGDKPSDSVKSSSTERSVSDEDAASPGSDEDAASPGSDEDAASPVATVSTSVGNTGRQRDPVYGIEL